MKSTKQLQTYDLLSVLQGVQSAPPGDMKWAEHCARQQAVILRLESPRGTLDSIATLADVTGIAIELVDDIPVAGTAFQTPNGWRIHVSTSLAPAAQVHIALHELKHILDHGHRLKTRDSAFSHIDYEHLAEFFAKNALANYENDQQEKEES
ncbi:hypothetical protein [Tsukamurella tyrosinosolvens]|uniref:hypothetical protein n=1 Tax=Tsukamurella tyrosinosolvens TaxID=57704 RepID=UPI000A6BC8B2|nr:hypothetical protein [Tsukamurella tyrosinosolvens]